MGGMQHVLLQIRLPSMVPVTGEELCVQIEEDNKFDVLAVAIYNVERWNHHVPRKDWLVSSTNDTGP